MKTHCGFKNKLNIVFKISNETIVFKPFFFESKKTLVFRRFSKVKTIFKTEKTIVFKRKKLRFKKSIWIKYKNLLAMLVLSEGQNYSRQFKKKKTYPREHSQT